MAASKRCRRVSSSPATWGIAFELAFAAAIVYVPVLQQLFGTAALGPDTLAVIAPFPFIVWGIDELRRLGRRRRQARLN